MSEGTAGIRWGRGVVGGVLIEIALMLVTVPIYATMNDPVPTMMVVIPPATLIVALLFGAWAARPSGSPVLTGLWTGIVALLVYGLILLVAYVAAPDQLDSSAALSPSYIASHIFKVLGGLIGGYWVARRRTAPVAKSTGP